MEGKSSAGLQGENKRRVRVGRSHRLRLGQNNILSAGNEREKTERKNLYLGPRIWGWISFLLKKAP